ncbi:hypothetical protein [Nannocystis bainbridge]|uniref:Uncharacterized protein n=1 Tax=Nannocystis bainbridge TaxID=2995303 RepID=A0ABT5E250_9BACT|nr:hypothetical protein [Nannocystis bainbridge]MDC0719951.1 hypothetical protein [Nannocystis bainbridge]
MVRAPLVARGWWMVGLAESPPRLIVAPLGRYSPAHARDLGGGDRGGDLSAFLGLGHVDLQAPGAAEALAGWGWVEVGGSPAWEVPAPVAPRALLVGRRSPAFVGRNGPRPFEDSSGEQLARALGVGELSALLGTFETAYHGELDPGRLRGRHVVTLDLDTPLDAEGVASLAVLDRGMSRNAMSAGLLRSTIAARRGPELSEAEAEVLALVGAAESAGDGAVSASLRRAWDLAGPAGLAWPGSAPGSGWQRPDDSRELVRVFAGVRAEVRGPASPESREPWRASATSHGALRSRECADLESALLVAERLARTLGGMSPWEERDVGLAAAWRCAQVEGGA